MIDIIAAAGLFVIGVFINKFVERPVLWFQNRFIWPALTTAIAQSNTKKFWGLVDGALKDTDMPLEQAIAFASKSLGIDDLDLPEKQWEKFVAAKIAQFDYDAFRSRP